MRNEKETGLVGLVSKRPGKVVTICHADTAYRAAETMRDNGVGALVVIDERSKLVGIMTERDLVNRVVSAHVDPRSIFVKEIMTASPASCLQKTSLSRAQEIMMARRIRHLPVVEEAGTVVGMISSRDVMAYQVMADRAMRDAAEQVAMLSTCLKSLDFDEVINMVTREVPQLFQARRSILLFPSPKGPPHEPLLLSRHRCPCSCERFLSRQQVRDADTNGKICAGSTDSHCQLRGDPSMNVVVPLAVHGLKGYSPTSRKVSHGFLCMCGLPASSTSTREMIQYKGALIREVVNANLTNAKLYQDARQDALTDALTKVGSRRLLEEQLEAEFHRAKRYRRPFCVVMVDIDHFKTINDKLGHTKGDEVLQSFARLLAREKRITDVLARYGGDEFILLMPETDLEAAAGVLERIRVRTESAPMPEGLAMTVSCGAAQFTASSKLSANELVRCADLALYEAKRTGRNRVETWERIAHRFIGKHALDARKIEKIQSRVADMSHRSKEMFVQSIWGLVQALEARDKYTRSHSENVMRYAVGIAETMGASAADVALIRRAAMVHDIGKIGVPDSVLHKPGKLTREERSVMQQHPLIAVRILNQMRFLERELPIVRHHHEWWNGQGYPDGISGKDIPPGARILAVADAFDAITSDRIYRASRSVPEALQELQNCEGSQFDPRIVQAMLRWVERIARQIDKPGDLTAQDLLDFQKAGAVAAPAGVGCLDSP